MPMSEHTSYLHLSRRRTLRLQGGCNFRDIGGYRTHDGRAVKWGQIFRAGVLSYVTHDDHRALQALGVRSICDLRRAEERRKEPTRWPDVTARMLAWDDGIGVPTLRSHAAERPATAAGMFDAMIALYQGLPRRMHERLRGFLTCIADGDVPLIVHCAAGKDRTGFAIAVLLLAVGVPRETVIEDYLLTNDVSDFESFIRSRESTEFGLADANHPLLAMPKEQRRVLLSAQPEFLSAALDQIDREFGGLDSYIDGTLRIDASVRDRVMANLLE